MFSFGFGNFPAESAFFTATSGKSKVFFNLHICGGAGHGILENASEKGGSFVFRNGGNVLSRKMNGTFVNGPYSGDCIEQGGFSCAVAADYGNKISVLKVKIDSLKGFFLGYGTGIESFVNSF